MFANVALLLPTQHPVLIVPLLAVVHASYGDSLFVVDDKTGDDGSSKKVARQQFVRVGETRGDFVSVLDGVKNGDEIVTSGAFKLRNNSTVLVNNTVQPRAELTPHPENR
jgi:membrane fusion protein (multidrug efflux system)